MATPKAVIVNATKKFFEVPTISRLLADQGVKITEVNGVIELSITLATPELIAEQREAIEATWKSQLEATVTLIESGDPVSQDEENTEYEQVFKMKVDLPTKAPKASKRPKNLPMAEWGKDTKVSFRIRNFNRPQDGDILTQEVPHAEAEKWRDVVVSGNGTGGFQMLLECENAEGEVIGWAKKYCSRDEALAHVPEGKDYKNPAQLEREAQAATKAEATLKAKAEKAELKAAAKVEKDEAKAAAKAEKAATKATAKAAKAAQKEEDALNTEAEAEAAIDAAFPDSTVTPEVDEDEAF